MRIVIDMQGAQTESRFRGIGRYTLGFVQGVVRNCGEHEVILALSGLFPDTIEPVRAAFDGLLPQENIRVWQAPGPVAECSTDNDSRREVAELVREAFLASLNPDVVHICSLFEGYGDDAVSSIGRFDKRTPVSVSLYDLIPLLNPAHYLEPNPRYAQYYRRKIEYLKQAAVCLAISDFSRREGEQYLDVPVHHLVSVSTAIESSFQPVDIDADDVRKLLGKFGITRSFVLYTGGADERKNLPRLIEAYARLPQVLRDTHQLLLAGKMSDGEVARFDKLASANALKADELCFTGYVSDEELIQLYNLCKLFVFPSWHEGFGLPALEAMACGAPVIGANTSSLPEVIDLDEALFNPLDVTAITAKMEQALENDSFRCRLREHGSRRSRLFSWDKTGKLAIQTWESLCDSLKNRGVAALPDRSKPRLAFVTPLPPERTGIADYSAALLPDLAEYYDIEIVVAQDKIDLSWVGQHANVRDVAWFRENADALDRVVYQVGNSPFHQHMLPLLTEIPGTVVLHDFYLSGLMSWLELEKREENAWCKALYAAHGYPGVMARFLDPDTAKCNYPVNLSVLQLAQGIIVHSEHSRSLAREWYDETIPARWEVIPLVRKEPGHCDKQTAREQLGFAADTFIVCSFGFLDPTKLNHRLLDAWLSSALAVDKNCCLVFVGENHGGDYGSNLLDKIRSSGLGDRIRVTGFASPIEFQNYLIAADMAVQLRTQSRGETSAAVLDCMNHALPVIVNANGSMAEIDTDAVWMLPDQFKNDALVGALEALWASSARRQAFGERARNLILDQHSPHKCAQRYVAAIERFHTASATATLALINAIAAQERFVPNDAVLVELSEIIAATLPVVRPAKRLLLDISATCRDDLKTGIERVARALLLALLQVSPKGYRVEPVYLSNVTGRWHYRFARRYTLKLLQCPIDFGEDEIVDPQCGDVLLGLDLSGDVLVQAEAAGLFDYYRAIGVSVYFMVHDLLPILMPDVFPPGAAESFSRWLNAVSRVDGAVCVSRSVANDLVEWLPATSSDRRPFKIDWSHHGADIGNSAPSSGLPDDAERVLLSLQSRPSFLMVGTIEPRKGYLQTIEAFSLLWQKGLDINLVIVGREGWKGLGDEMRRDIPRVVESMRSHPEKDIHLFWLEGISDEYLERVYASSTCLIAASEGEGFGLPLIEAAQHKLPIIARDIPVFREVAGEQAYYFDATTPAGLADVLKAWLQLFDLGKHPKSDEMPWLTWEESARHLRDVLLQKR